MAIESRGWGRGRVLAGAALVLALTLARPHLATAADTTAIVTQLDRLEIDVVRAEDVHAIKKLQRAYGFYADRGRWEELADLFADDAVANYPSGGFDGNASIRAMFVQNLGQGKAGLAEGRIYNHTILQPVVDLAPDGATATGRWRVLGMLGRFGVSATWADSLYRFDYVKQRGRWKIKSLIAYAGSGGGYENGWVPPKPRPPGAIDRSPVRFNLAHPADRPWIDPCEADVSVCVVPFPYPNRSTILARPAEVSAVTDAAVRSSVADRAADLIQRAHRLQDEQEVLNLQHTYGYYLDRGLWTQAANLFAADGSREVGQAGVYVGREHIRRSLGLAGPQGLRAGQLNDYMQFEPIVDVAPDGRSAKGRIFELAFVGGGGEPARIIQNVEENEYVRVSGTWMIRSAHHYTILATDYDQGWARSALPPPAASQTFAPDRPPTVIYEAYPKVYTPPLHFVDAPTVKPVSGIAGSSAALPSERRIAAATRQVRRVMDYDEVENLQNAYGYYAEKSLWTDIAQLFTHDGVLQIDDRSLAGRDRILAFLDASGPQGPVQGALDSQLQLQPVIHVAADGRTARIRSRLLQLTRDPQGRPMWGGGIFENELEKERGVWKFRRLHLYRTYRVNYQGGWVKRGQWPAGDGGQLFPSRFTPPFHFRSVASQ